MAETSVGFVEGQPGYSEALATWTTRYLDPSGFECMLSIQAETGIQVIKKAEGAITHLSELKCLPLQTGHHNGNGHEQEIKAETNAEVKIEDNPGKHICPIHHVEMTRWSKNGRSWYAHRLENGYWCKGKP